MKLLLIFFLFSNCAMFQFSRHSDFAEWYFGKAGFYQTLQVPDLKKGKCFGDSEDYNYIIIADIAITKMENACGTKNGTRF